MKEYRHYVAGFFARRGRAEETVNEIVARGLPRERLQVFETEPVPSSPEKRAKSDEALTDVLVDTSVGTAVGTGLGALAHVAIIASDVTLFIASPLVATLAMLGWGASIGAVIGAAIGMTAGHGNKKGWLSDLIRDAIANGQVVLVAETRNEAETLLARDVIKAAVGEVSESKDANATDESIAVS